MQIQILGSRVSQFCQNLKYKSRFQVFFVFCSFAAQVAPNTGFLFFSFSLHRQNHLIHRLLVLFSISIEVPVDSQTVSLVEQIKRKQTMVLGFFMLFSFVTGQNQVILYNCKFRFTNQMNTIKIYSAKMYSTYSGQTGQLSPRFKTSYYRVGRKFMMC